RRRLRQNSVPENRARRSAEPSCRKTGRRPRPGSWRLLRCQIREIGSLFMPDMVAKTTGPARSGASLHFPGRDGKQIAVGAAGLFADVVQIFIGKNNQEIGARFFQMVPRRNRNVGPGREFVLLEGAVFNSEGDQ